MSADTADSPGPPQAAAAGPANTSAAPAQPPTAPATSTPPAPPGAPAKVHRIGLLTGGTAISRLAEGSAALSAFREALAELGYVEGHNIVIERRDAEGRFQLLRGMALELIGLGCEVLLAPSNIDAEAAREATSTLPIVFVGADPVGTGLVESLERPGGNLTGLTMASHARGRRMALLKELVPGLTRAAVLVNLAYTSVPFQLRQTELAAQSLAVPLRRFEVRDAKDLGDALGGVARGHPDGLIVLNHPLFLREARRIAQFAARNKLPMVAPYSRIAEAGGLVSYEPDVFYPFRRAATCVDRILKGASPGTLPVEECTRFRLVVNAKAARAMGLRVPKAVLERADHIIQ